ncbi:Sulfate/thiosulfate import ATP-binding protein CysA [compost metagenome]
MALARVLALEPEILLLDEPFSQIDSFRKNALRRNLFSYLKAKGITCIIATHDSTDALSFSDETIVMQNGKVIARNTPKALFENPSNKYIASLFGEVNELKSSFFTLNESDEKTILVYPYQLKAVDNGPLKVVVKQSYFKGSRYLVKAVFDRKIIFFEHDSELAPNQEVTLALS